MSDRSLDVRDLPPCEPLERVLAALQTLPAGDVLVVTIHREPFPLYALLPRLGCAHSTAPRPDGGFEVRITRAP
ncbi:MAG: DUF2249 domain-containing protein [Deltaproteobacteria bacterium]|nr:DUF2249 domain-containing protein [Deltaproteobacteria bacterium]